MVPTTATSLSVRNPGTKILHRIQEETNGILIEKDHNFIIDRMNVFADKLNKLNGYNSDEIAKQNEKRSIRLPSSKNEEIIKQLDALQAFQ